MTINKRITQIRKEAGLTKGKFGEQIGLKQSQAGFIEKDGTTVTDRVIQLICSNFHVSEEWLVNGTGEQYVEDAENILTQLAKEFKLSPSMETLIKSLCSMPADTQNVLVEYIERTAAEMQEARKKAEEARKAREKDVSAIPRPDGITDEEWAVMLMALEEDRHEKGTQNTKVSSSLG